MSEKNRESGQKRTGFDWKSEVRFWLILGGVIVLLYATGWHTAVLGTLQRGLLFTGLFNADTTVVAGERYARGGDLSVIARDGELMDLEDWKGDLLFINFWATWCPPCVREMPSIERVYAVSAVDPVVYAAFAEVVHLHRHAAHLLRTIPDARSAVFRTQVTRPTWRTRGRSVSIWISSSGTYSSDDLQPRDGSGHPVVSPATSPRATD